MKKRLVIICLFMVLVVNSWMMRGYAHELVTSNQELLDLFTQSLTDKVDFLSVTYRVTDDEFYLNDVGPFIQRALGMSDPYTRNSVKSWDISVSSLGNEINIEISLEYLSNREEDLYVFQEVKNIIAEIITPRMDPHQMMKSIYGYVVEGVVYDYSYTYYSAYEALVKGTAVCQGYALLLHQLLKEVGIEGTIIQGQMDNTLHGWNLVKLNEHWYHMDVTQDSTHYHTHGENPYNHYALMDNQIGRTHLWIREDYPEATYDYLEELLALKETYPQRRDLYDSLIRDLNLHFLLDAYTTYEQEHLKEIIQGALLAKEPSVSMRSFDPFYNNDLFRAILQEVATTYQEVGQNLAGYSAQRRRYNRDNYSNSIILTIFFRYHH